MTNAYRYEQLGRAKGHLKYLEAQLPPGAELVEPLVRLLNAIAAVRNRIRHLEAAIKEEPQGAA